MKLYSSFLVRCWLTRDISQDERRVLQVEHIQTGVTTRASSLAEAERWMFEAARPNKSSGGPIEDAGSEDGDAE
jgi:hypothetical protein